MISSAVTISLVNEARGGPFVFWDDLSASIRRAAELGYDAVEVFAPSPADAGPERLRQLLDQHGLKLAAVGTGAGMVIHGLSLTDPDAAQRSEAKAFVRSIIDLGGPLGAPAIIGSMQGRWGGQIDKPAALEMLAEALDELGKYASQYNVPLIYEPLNRYETNLVCTMADGVTLLKRLSGGNVKLLADLFHMNIEETDLAAAIRTADGHLGHVHFVDSNRRPAGCGHLEFEPIAAALADIKYDGYASAEAFPYPSPDQAAKLTIEAFNQHFR